MDGEVVDAGIGNGAGMDIEVGDPDTGHREALHLVRDGHNRPGRLDLERGAHGVAVEEEVEVLVVGHPAHDGRAGRVVDVSPGVVVRDPGGQLLKSDVGETLQGIGRLGDLPALHLGHPRPLQADGIDRPRHGEIVVDHLPVAALLGRPAPHPMAPRAVAAEHALDVPEVVRQVVLRQDVDEQRTAGLGTEAGLRWVPLVVVGIVPAPAPGDQLVRMPLPGLTKVPLVEPLNAGLEFGQQLMVGIDRHEAG